MTAELVTVVAAYGLEGSRAVFPQGPLADDEWTSLLAAVRHQRLTGLLVAAATDGALAVTDEQYEEAADAHVQALALVLRLDRMLLRLAARFREGGIDLRVLKGTSAAHRLYPDPSLRCFGDVDLLVRSDDFDGAVRLVEAESGERQFRQPRAGFDRRFSKGTSFSMPGGMEVDLHRTFVSGAFGLTVDLSDLWSRSWSFTIGGVPLEALDADTSFLHLCYHAALGDAVPRLVPLRDIAQALLRDDLDIERVVAMCRRWRAEAAMARALVETWTTLELELDHPLHQWALRYHPTRNAERTLAAYSRSGNVYGYQALTAVRAIKGAGAKAAYVRAIVFPERSYVDGRYRGQWDRWRRSLEVIRSRAGGKG